MMAHLTDTLSSTGSMLLLAFGFGFVIFWHELGHFLAAKWADVKVEQFAVGFGQALLSWRKGLGFRWGSTNDDFQKRIKDHLAARQESQQNSQGVDPLVAPTEMQLSAAAAEMGISETEYRLNWIPLGGYVKMLGQDDMKPGQTVSDPRSYNNKSISQRMVIVSAGVIMNVILAALGFMYIFTVGFDAPVPKIGAIQPGSPAQKTYRLVDGKQVPAPLQVGDRILTMDGRSQSDFDKIRLNTMLLLPGETVPMQVQHVDGAIETLYITPQKSSADAEFPAIGVVPYKTLEAIPASELLDMQGQESDELNAIKPGDVITAVNGVPVKPDEYYKVDAALQAAAGKPIDLTITNAGQLHSAKFYPHFLEHFADAPMNLVGMQMRTTITSVETKSPVLGKLLPGDVIVDIADRSPSGEHIENPTVTAVRYFISKAGETQTPLVVTVLRGGKEMAIPVVPSFKIEPGKRGLGIGMAMDEVNPVIAGVMENSPARAAGLMPGSTVVSVNGKPVHNWFDINNALGESKPDQPVEIVATARGTTSTYTIKSLSGEQLDDLRSNHLTAYGAGMLNTDNEKLTAANPWQAAKMGAGETRDAILQVYQTVRSMIHGSISAKEVSGPVGIITVGYKVAEKGTTKLIWFLSVISANLAVMNFLPIPIVDGGLFTFLIIEKIKGSPISPRVQAIAQVVGLALLLSVFLFATYQDVFVRLPVLFR